MCFGVFVQLNEGNTNSMSQKYPVGYVIQENGCWDWVGTRISGYGWWAENGRGRRAHRLLYERVKGPVPRNLQLDHLCRNRACVNPDHLEPVTPRENTMRGNTPARANTEKTQCPQGHSYDPANTIITKEGWRQCRTCGRERQARKRREAP